MGISLSLRRQAEEREICRFRCDQDSSKTAAKIIVGVIVLGIFSISSKLAPTLNMRSNFGAYMSSASILTIATFSLCIVFKILFKCAGFKLRLIEEAQYTQVQTLESVDSSDELSIENESSDQERESA